MKNVASLAKALEEFLKMDPMIATTTVQLFLVVAAFPGRTVRFYCDYTGHSQASVSRNVAALGKVHRKGKEGLDLVSPEPNPEGRGMIVELTERGRRLATAIDTLIN